ncbi:hypothetical protein JB92DRAFT_2827771 [Gautieria morchelliformis]|nr:hypothetical protein JB92DRAFT_2827771 [Gautieria morchelliformis]
MGNKRSQSALRKAAAAKKKNCNESVQVDGQHESVEPAKLDENDDTHQSRPVRKKIPTVKLLESLESHPAESDSSTQASKEDHPYISDGSQEVNTTYDLSDASDSDLASEVKEVKVAVVNKGRGRPPKQEELSDLDRAGSTRVTIPLICSFEIALRKLHDAIGCQNIPKKPILQYKMEKTGRTPISLENEKDWQGLREHVKTLGKKDKIIQGEIVIEPKEYIKALRNKLKESSMKDSLGDEGGLDEEQEQAEKHLSEYAKLEQLLTKCQKCGPDIWCKVNKHGWATALAMGIDGVSHTNPPRSELFAEFHMHKPDPESHPGVTQPTQAIAPAIPAIPAPTADMAVVQAMTAMMMGMAGLVGANGGKAQQVVPQTPSADLSLAIDYPGIEEFFLQLAAANPRRNFNNLTNQLLEWDFYTIDELAQENEAFSEAPPYSLSQGNARFVVRSVRDQVRRVKKQHNMG